MTTEEAVKIIEKYIADTKDFNKKMKNFGIKIEELAFYDEDMSFLNALKKVLKKLNEEQKKNLVLRRQRDDARKSVQEACENAFLWSDKWVYAANAIDRAKKHIEEDMAHNNQFNCGDLQLILDILEEEQYRNGFRKR